jgi:hypothetical protein
VGYVDYVPWTADRPNANAHHALIEKGRTVNTLNVWCTRFHATLTLSFFDPIRKQQQHAEACIGGKDDYDYYIAQQ